MATKVETAAGLSTTEPESAAPPPTEDGKSKVEKHEKPEKPDEEQFRADVAAAEQEHGALMEKLVSLSLERSKFHDGCHLRPCSITPRENGVANC